MLSFLAVFIVFIAPAFANLLINDFLAFMITQAAVAMMQIMLFMLFFFLII